jgi:hypothetical protein
VDKADTHWWEPKTETETEAETGVPPTEEVMENKQINQRIRKNSNRNFSNT